MTFENTDEEKIPLKRKELKNYSNCKFIFDLFCIFLLILLLIATILLIILHPGQRTINGS